MADEISKACENMCRMTAEEREWVHTARKYINSRHLPMLGSILKALDDTAYFIGKSVLLAVISLACGSLLWWVFIRVK